MLPQVLYLDTARLGQISPSAKRALNSALEFNKAYGASAYFDEFLFGGATTLRDANEFDGLDLWEGIDRFKAEISRHFFGTEDGEVIFANRTASLMSLAAKMLFARCRNVLVTDLNWDSYSRILANSKPNESCQISVVRISDLIFNQGSTAEEVTRAISKAYFLNDCDGLFLQAVCNRDIHIPVSSIVKRIKNNAKLRFSVVDAAQAINHVDISWARDDVDFIFGGTHKWLKSFEPMAIGYFGLPSSTSFVSDTITRELNNNPLADSLTRMSHAAASQFEETINLCPLFAAAGALEDAKRQITCVDASHARSVIKSVAGRTGWKCCSKSHEFQSRILLLKKPQLQNADAGIIRKMLFRLGIAVTEYSGGVCRISLPETIDDEQADRLESALKIVT